jgi:hypothetical protein
VRNICLKKWGQFTGWSEGKTFPLINPNNRKIIINGMCENCQNGEEENG